MLGTSTSNVSREENYAYIKLKLARVKRKVARRKLKDADHTYREAEWKYIQIARREREEEYAFMFFYMLFDMLGL